MTASDVREATFCFVDLAGSTALTETHGDRAAADLVDRFVALVDASLDNETHLVDTIGDAVLTMSSSPEKALEFVASLFSRAEAEPAYGVGGLSRTWALRRLDRRRCEAAALFARRAVGHR